MNAPNADAAAPPNVGAVFDPKENPVAAGAAVLAAGAAPKENPVVAG